MNMLKKLLAKLKKLANPAQTVDLPKIKRAPFMSRPAGSMRSLNEKKAKALRREARKILGDHPADTEVWTNTRPRVGLHDGKPILVGWSHQDILTGGLRFVNQRLKRIVRHGEILFVGGKPMGKVMS